MLISNLKRFFPLYLWIFFIAYLNLFDSYGYTITLYALYVGLFLFIIAQYSFEILSEKIQGPKWLHHRLVYYLFAILLTAAIFFMTNHFLSRFINGELHDYRMNYIPIIFLIWSILYILYLRPRLVKIPIAMFIGSLLIFILLAIGYYIFSLIVGIAYSKSTDTDNVFMVISNLGIASFSLLLPKFYTTKVSLNNHTYYIGLAFLFLLISGYLIILPKPEKVADTQENRDYIQLLKHNGVIDEYGRPADEVDIHPENRQVIVDATLAAMNRSPRPYIHIIESIDSFDSGKYTFIDSNFEHYFNFNPHTFIDTDLRDKNWDGQIYSELTLLEMINSKLDKPSAWVFLNVDFYDDIATSVQREDDQNKFKGNFYTLEEFTYLGKNYVVNIHHLGNQIKLKLFNEDENLIEEWSFNEWIDHYGSSMDRTHKMEDVTFDFELEGKPAQLIINKFSYWKDEQIKINANLLLYFEDEEILPGLGVSNNQLQINGDYDLLISHKIGSLNPKKLNINMNGHSYLIESSFYHGDVPFQIEADNPIIQLSIETPDAVIFDNEWHTMSFQKRNDGMYTGNTIINDLVEVTFFNDQPELYYYPSYFDDRPVYFIIKFK